MRCSTCGVVTTHRVFFIRDANGKVTRTCTCEGVRNAPAPGLLADRPLSQRRTCPLRPSRHPRSSASSSVAGRGPLVRITDFAAFRQPPGPSTIAFCMTRSERQSERSRGGHRARAVR